MGANLARYSVTVSALALRQLGEACAYIHDQGAPLAAQRMAARFIAAIETLERQPFRGRPVSRGLYELVTVRPYVIRYRIRGDAVEVAAMARGGQPRARAPHPRSACSLRIICGGLGSPPCSTQGIACPAPCPWRSPSPPC